MVCTIPTRATSHTVRVVVFLSLRSIIAFVLCTKIIAVRALRVRYLLTTSIKVPYDTPMIKSWIKLAVNELIHEWANRLPLVANTTNSFHIRVCTFLERGARSLCITSQFWLHYRTGITKESQELIYSSAFRHWLYSHICCCCCMIF